MVEPYYSEAGVTIYHADCRDVIPALTYDAVVMDPPYGTGWYKTDQAILTPGLLRTLAAVPLACFGYPERLCVLLAAADLTASEWVTWWPTNGACRGFNLAGLRNESEHIAIIGKHRFATLRQARSASSRRFVEADYRRADGSAGRGMDSQGDLEERRLGDVWTDMAPGLAFNAPTRFHPNEKPLAVMVRLVEGMTEAGQIVIDPFMGSGTTLRAAKDCGRKAIGIEVEERYCEVAVKRLAQGVLWAS